MTRRAHPLPALFVFILIAVLCAAAAAAASSNMLNKSFSARADARPPPLSASGDLLFQGILQDPSGKFAFGFLKEEKETGNVDVAVVHLASGFPVWRGGAASAARSGGVVLSFDGVLTLADGDAALWKAGSPEGSLVQLNPSSNLEVLAPNGSALWQSFGAPSDTLVTGQNLSASAALTSADGRFALRLGPDFMALYMGVAAYWKTTALQTDGSIVPGGGPIYARLNQTGYLALYQNETNRIHAEPFDTSNRNLSGLWRLTLEDDGNLKAYYWNASAWLLAYSALRDACDLPAQCGAYGLCLRAQPTQCQCLDGAAARAGPCAPPAAGDLCGGENFTALRRAGVELAYSNLLPPATAGSREECELRCERNCTCWGALFNNQTSSCFLINFPVETLVKAPDNRLGYFKLRVTPAPHRGASRKRAAIACLLALAAVFSVSGAALWWRRRQQRPRAAGLTLMGEGLSPGAYKEFRASTSFRDVELSSNRQ